MSIRSALLEALIVALFFTTCPPLFAADRPAGPIHKTRSAVMARHGMAATSQPLATAAAIRVLQAGGNAIDAAIAANAVLGLVEPTSCGLGGDLFAIVWDARSKKLYGLNASGRAPLAATIDLYHSKGYRDIPSKGPLSWSVPGCVSGWEALRTKVRDEALLPSRSPPRSPTPRRDSRSARSSPRAGGVRSVTSRASPRRPRRGSREGMPRRPATSSRTPGSRRLSG